jgi:hypothetical protein
VLANLGCVAVCRARQVRLERCNAAGAFRSPPRSPPNLFVAAAAVPAMANRADDSALLRRVEE